MKIEEDTAVQRIKVFVVRTCANALVLFFLCASGMFNFI
jgi:hypothetical protein